MRSLATRQINGFCFHHNVVSRSRDQAAKQIPLIDIKYFPDKTSRSKSFFNGYVLRGQGNVRKVTKNADWKQIERKTFGANEYVGNLSTRLSKMYSSFFDSVLDFCSNYWLV